MGLGRALGRNTIKIAVPWTLGHIVAFGAVNGGFERGEPLTVTVAGLLYALLLATTLMGLLGAGRAVHDRLGGTLVVTQA